jgi:hypothetical protein
MAPAPIKEIQIAEKTIQLFDNEETKRLYGEGVSYDLPCTGFTTKEMNYLEDILRERISAAGAKDWLLTRESDEKIGIVINKKTASNMLPFICDALDSIASPEKFSTAIAPHLAKEAGENMRHDFAVGTEAKRRVKPICEDIISFLVKEKKMHIVKALRDDILAVATEGELARQKSR